MKKLLIRDTLQAYENWFDSPKTAPDKNGNIVIQVSRDSIFSAGLTVYEAAECLKKHNWQVYDYLPEYLRIDGIYIVRKKKYIIAVTYERVGK